jgi:NAD(P)H-flavin reductase
MAILKPSLTLVSNRPLTRDVHELVFQPSEPLNPAAGQYVLFDIDTAIKRAYSIAFAHPDGRISFVIKRLEGGRGSSVLCGLQSGDTVNGMGPLGHFTLKETDASKCFIGTGTGFAPLYFQLKRCAELGYSKPMRLVFGVREGQDLFYADEITEIGNVLPAFSYHPYVSREDVPETSRGYVTDFITPETVAEHEEFYLCGSPAMVKDARLKLESLGVAKEKIFFEQY